MADGLLVKPDITQKQLDEDQQVALSSQQPIGDPILPEQSGETGKGIYSQTPDAEGSQVIQEPKISVAIAPALPRPFYGTTPLDALRVGRDVEQIVAEVIQNLTGQLGAKVEITLEIQAEISEGASEQLVRTVTENCRTLRFRGCSFEE